MKRVVRCTTALALTLSCLLFGCSASTPLQESARSIVCTPAFGEDYGKVQAAVAEKTADAQLIAVRSSSYAAADDASEWMYLYYSWDRSCAYTVFVLDGQAVAGEYATMAFTQGDLAAAPAVGDIAIDADAAYAAAVEALDGEDSVYVWRAYLMLCTEGADDSSEDVMQWVFQFNGKGDQEEFETVAEKACEDAASPFALCVDARTGEVRMMDAESAENAA